MNIKRCIASQKSSIKKCNIKTTPETNGFCHKHFIQLKNNSNIQIYNGSILSLGEVGYDLGSCTKPIYLWQEMNRYIYKIEFIKNRKMMEEISKVIKNGTQPKVIDMLINIANFKSSEEVISFFETNKKLKLKSDNKKLKSNNLIRARHFVGVIYWFHIKIKMLIKFQINIRIKLKYIKNIKEIYKIQKWYRYRSWIKKLPVKPNVMKKYYIPNIDKIKLIQRNVKNYIKIKVKHSHNCPYSMDNYWEIPKKYRVFYKHNKLGMFHPIKNNNGIFHWRYYDIRWLHNDFKTQTANKRFVMEPVLNKEFPEEFVEEIARRIWILTRVENDYAIDENKNNVQYFIEDDWFNRFKRRSLYCFSLMLLDVCNDLDIEIKNINNWRKPYFKLKYQTFYLLVMPAIKNLVTSSNTMNNILLLNIEEDIFHSTREIFKAEYIFPDTDISDDIAGDAIYGILRILIFGKKTQLNIYNLIKDILKENIQILLIM